MAINEIPSVGWECALLPNPGALTLLDRFIVGDNVNASGALSIDVCGERACPVDRQRLSNDRGSPAAPPTARARKKSRLLGTIGESASVTWNPPLGRDFLARSRGRAGAATSAIAA